MSKKKKDSFEELETAYNNLLNKFIDLKSQAEIIAEYILDELPNGYKPESEYIKSIEESARIVLETAKRTKR